MDLPAARGVPTVAEQPLEFTRLLYMLSQDMDNLTRHADMKAQIILAINAILTATAAGQAPAWDSASGLQTIAFAFGIATLMLMIGSVYFSLRTVLPRRVPPHDSQPRNLFFYEDIAGMDERAFVQKFEAQTLPELRMAVLTQAHAKAGVAQAKFDNVRRAVGLLFAAVSLWLLGRVLSALI